MAGIFLMMTVACVCVSAAPPSPHLYQQHPQAHVQQLNPLDYYLDNPEVANYYNQQHQKQGVINGGPGAPSRLETLEPDSEVELIPGAQQPQQPPQQMPVSPNLPGLVPGQRVFIVHMPVPGYRPGTIGGYQPVYIVAAAPQGNTGYPRVGNGFQNAVLLDPSGQAVLSPVFGYPRTGVAGVGTQASNPNILLGAPLTLNRPYDLIYQDPSVAYQAGPAPQGAEGNRGTVRLSQMVSLHGQAQEPGNSPRNAGNEPTPSNEPKRVGQASENTESKEATEEHIHNARPTPPHAQTRNKV